MVEYDMKSVKQMEDISDTFCGWFLYKWKIFHNSVGGFYNLIV